MNKKQIEKLCQWAYHRGRVGMCQNLCDLLNKKSESGDVAPWIKELSYEILNKEIMNLEKADKEFNNGI